MSDLERAACAVPDVGACPHTFAFAPEPAERIAHFAPTGSVVIRGRTFYYGPFPFKDQPSRNDVGLLGREVLCMAKPTGLPGLNDTLFPPL